MRKKCFQYLVDEMKILEPTIDRSIISFPFVRSHQYCFISFRLKLAELDFPCRISRFPFSSAIKPAAYFCYNLHMIEKRIKQVLIYREDACWIWQIVDAAYRELFADTVYDTRDEAVSSVADALKLMIKSLDGNNN